MLVKVRVTMCIPYKGCTQLIINSITSTSGNSYLPTSAIKFHNLTYHTEPAHAFHMQFLHSGQTISAMLSIATTLQP